MFAASPGVCGMIAATPVLGPKPDLRPLASPAGVFFGAQRASACFRRRYRSMTPARWNTLHWNTGTRFCAASDTRWYRCLEAGAAGLRRGDYPLLRAWQW